MADIYLTQNGKEYIVQSGQLLLPLSGNFSAHLSFDADVVTAPTGKATLTWLKKQFVGYVLPTRSGDVVGDVKCLFVGGNGGLDTQIAPKMYDYTVSARLPISEILNLADEVLSTQSDNTFVSKMLQNWVRRRGLAHELILDLSAQLGCLWQTKPDGSIYFGKHSFLQVPKFDCRLLAKMPTENGAHLIVDAVGVLPGDRFSAGIPDLQNRKVSCCLYSMTPEESRLSVWFLDEDQTDLVDQMHSGLTGYIRETMRDVRYHASIPGVVALQRTDGTLDVYPDNPAFPPLTSVPVRVPVGGTKVKVNPNERVNIVFESGDPTKYAAQLYESGPGGRKLARKDGLVNVGKIVFSTVANGVLTGTYTPPVGAPISFTLGSPFDLTGKITDGWSRWEVTDE